MAQERFSYGGQAIIEGVMIRGRKGYALACRLASGGIQAEEHVWEPISKRHWLLGLPILRGTPALLDALFIGYKSLMRSGDIAAEGEGIKPPSALHYALSIAIALAIAVGGFVLGPAALTKPVPAATAGGNMLKYLLEGLIRIAFFLAFIYAVSHLRDMRRVFQYHGAEHKVIHAYEATGTYTAAQAEPFSTLHPRCGTSFIFTVMLVGILVHALVSWQHGWAVVLASRLLLLPVVAGLSYEVIRMAGRYEHSRLLGVMVAPGMWLQRITTQPPTPDMIEVAIRALERALVLDGVQVPARDPEAV